MLGDVTWHMTISINRMEKINNNGSHNLRLKIGKIESKLKTITQLRRKWCLIEINHKIINNNRLSSIV